MYGNSEKTPSRAALVAGFATIYLAWGSTYLGMKVAVGTMPPFAMASARFLLAGAILAAINRLRGLPRATRRQWLSNTVIGVLLLLGGNGLVAWAEQFLPSGLTALLLGLSPFWIVWVEWMWPGGRRPSVMTLSGLGLGLLGAAWLAAPWERGAGATLPTGGLVAILIAGLSWAIGSIAARETKNAPPLLVAAAAQMISGGAALGCVAVLRGEMNGFELASISRESWVAWWYLLAVALISFPTYGWLIRHSTPARVSTYAYVNPVIAVCLGWLVLGETISSQTIIALAIIVGAVVLVKAQREQQATVPAAIRLKQGAMRPDLANAAVAPVVQSRDGGNDDDAEDLGMAARELLLDVVGQGGRVTPMTRLGSR